MRGDRERRSKSEDVVSREWNGGLEGTIQVDLKEIGAYRDRSEVEIGREENWECEGGRMMEMEGGNDGDVEGGKDAKLGEQRSGSIPERFWSAGCSLCKVNT